MVLFISQSGSHCVEHSLECGGDVGETGLEHIHQRVCTW